MSNAYDDARDVEKRGMQPVAEWIKRQFRGDTLIDTNDPGVREYLQKFAGDFLVQDVAGHLVTVEAKIEEKWTGNLFIEIWSNRSRGTRGWFHNSRADYLVCYFIDKDRLVYGPMRRLQDWWDADGSKRGFPLVKQSKYSQLNDTWGALVPVSSVNHIVTDYRLSDISKGRRKAAS